MERSMQRSSRDDLVRELFAEVQAVEADIEAAQGAAVLVDAFRNQVQAACHDASAVLRTLHAAPLSPEDARRMRETTLARLQDQRAALALADQVRGDAADRIAHAAHRLTAARHAMKQLIATVETT
jgi:hypothetical protein